MADKTPMRVVRMRLPVDLIAALETMAAEVVLPISRQPYRTLQEMIQCSLKYAAWAYSHGRGPDAEMLPNKNDDRGYPKWDEKFREPDEIAELERLYQLGGSEDTATEDAGI